MAAMIQRFPCCTGTPRLDLCDSTSLISLDTEILQNRKRLLPNHLLQIPKYFKTGKDSIVSRIP